MELESSDSSPYTKMVVKTNPDIVYTNIFERNYNLPMDSNNKLSYNTTHSIAINLTGSQIEHLPPAKYIAYLENNDKTITSKPTHFEIIDTLMDTSLDIMADTINKNLIVKFKASSNPVYMTVCKPDGAPFAIKQLSVEERKNEEAIFNPFILAKKQKTSLYNSNLTYYIQIYYQGDYGVCSDRYDISSYMETLYPLYSPED